MQWQTHNTLLPYPLSVAPIFAGRVRTQNPAVSWLLESSSFYFSPSNIIMPDSVLPGIPGYNPHNLQPWTATVVVSMTVLATVAVAIRLFSRYLKAQKGCRAHVSCHGHGCFKWVVSREEGGGGEAGGLAYRPSDGTNRPAVQGVGNY